MSVDHLEIMVEEPSMEAFLHALLPRLLGETITFDIYPFLCKDDLLNKLTDRLRGYRNWLPENYRILVIVDRDDDDCCSLKKRMEEAAVHAGLRTRTTSKTTGWQVANRIAIEELEAWYFGDWDAVCQAYPRVPPTIPQRAGYRDPDTVRGGTWEAFERLLRKSGYFKAGLRKIDAAQTIGHLIVPERNHSYSFVKFHEVLREIIYEQMLV